MANLYISFLRLPLLVRFLLIVLFVFFSFGITIHFLEPKTFPSVYDGIWWAIITASTVGYGDYVPHTFWGRLTGLILILFGVAFVSSYFGTLAVSAFSKQNDFTEGKISFKGKGHTIIVGWNERSRELISKLTNTHNPQMIILIDSTLEANPVNSRFVHFIKGKAHVDETILKSDIDTAKKVLITADRGSPELQADMNSILTLLTIKGLCPNVKCIVEILTAEQVINAIRAGADEIIQSNKLISVFMGNSLHCNNEGLLSDVVHQLEENRLSLLPLQEHEIGKTFQEIHHELLTKGFLLIGIKRAEETLLHPSHSTQIHTQDQLIVLK